MWSSLPSRNQITEAATFFILSEYGEYFTSHKQPFVALDEVLTTLKALVMVSLRFHNDNGGPLSWNVS